MQNDLFILEDSLSFSLRETHTSYDSAISFSGLYLKEIIMMSENVHNSLIKRAKTQAWWHMLIIPALSIQYMLSQEMIPQKK
jgi:hypothetical protein